MNDLFVLLSSVVNRFDIIIHGETRLEKDFNIIINDYQVFHSYSVFNKVMV